MFGFNRGKAKTRKTRKSPPRSKPQNNPELYCVWCKKQCGSASGFTVHNRSFKHFRNYEVGKEQLQDATEYLERIFMEMLTALPEFQTGVSALTVYGSFKPVYPVEDTYFKTLDALVRALAQKNLLEIVDEKNLIVKQVDPVTSDGASGSSPDSAPDSASVSAPAPASAAPTATTGASAGANDRANYEVPDVIDLP